MAPHRDTIQNLMAPAPSFLGICTGVVGVAGASKGLQEMAKDAKKFWRKFVHKKCEECEEMVKGSDLDAHMQKHRDDEAKKREEEEKKTQEEKNKELQRTIQELNRKILQIQIQMEEKERNALKREVRQQEQIDLLKTKVTCGVCGMLLPAMQLDGHVDSHRKDRSNFRCREDEKAAGKEGRNRKGTNGKRK